MSVEKLADWKTFVWHRFIRLYPAYWISVTLTALAIFVTSLLIFKGNADYVMSGSFALKYICNLTMFQYFMQIENIDGPYWTLSIELVFYALMTLILITKKLKYFEKIGTGLVLISSIYYFDQIYHNIVFHYILFYFPLLKYFPLFFAGILIYKMKYDKITFFRLFGYGLTLLVQCLVFHNCYSNKSEVTIYEYSIVLSVIYAVVLLFLFDKLSFIVNPITRKLGELSYSLYLIHQFLGISVFIPGFIKFLHFNFWLAAFLSLIVLLGISFLINKFIEKPAMQRYRNFIKPN